MKNWNLILLFFLNLPNLLFLNTFLIVGIACVTLISKINQSIIVSIDEWMNESINQSKNQWINQSINHSMNESFNQPINQSNNQSDNQFIHESINNGYGLIKPIYVHCQ